jgi:hypothetical protein
VDEMDRRRRNEPYLLIAFLTCGRAAAKAMCGQ